MNSGLLGIAGSICILLWGSYMVRSVVENTFAAELRKLLLATSGSRFLALISGGVAALVMQSATATTLLTTSFLSNGLIPLGFCVAIILGADLGSAIAARILFLDLSFLVPVGLIIGLSLHLFAQSWKWKQMGQVFIGLGFILLSIQLMKQNVGPLLTSPQMQETLVALSSVTWLAFIAIAAFTWLAHSSVAVILVIATLAESGILSIELFLPMLLGANLGAALIPYFLVNRRHLDSRAAVSVNLLMRGGLAIVLLLTAKLYAPYISSLTLTDGELVVFLHLAFNALLVLSGLWWVNVLSSKVKAQIRSRNVELFGEAQSLPGGSLDPEQISSPVHALSSSHREALRLADNVEQLFEKAISMFDARDRSQIMQIIELDKEINSRHRSIQQYLSEARRSVSKPKQEKKLDRILQFSSSMESIGDSISHELARLAIKKLDRNVNLSNAGQDEIRRIHFELLGLLRLEIDHFTTGSKNIRKEMDIAAQEIQSLCDTSISNHRKRLSDRKKESQLTSSIHQDCVREFMKVLNDITLIRAV